jgi:hypothetical protein
MLKRKWDNGKNLPKKDGGYHYLHKTARWLKKREQQLKRRSACLADNYTKAANVVHHVIDHKGDYNLFFSSPVISLCKSCHDNIKYGTHVQHGCDVHGRPYARRPIFIDHNKAKDARR